MRKRLYAALIALSTTGLSANTGSQPADSIPAKRTSPRFLALNTSSGIILPLNSYLSRGALPWYTSATFKYGIYASGERWEDFAYGMTYYGIGLYTARIHNKEALGRPVSLFLLQGGDLKHFPQGLSLKYELNLGMSFNWKAYDPFVNPDNVALGSSTNVHVGAYVYLKKQLSPRWDLHAGLGLTHFSNGAQRLPNKGINEISPYVELAYNLDPALICKRDKKPLTPPAFKRRIDYDILFTSASRQIAIDSVLPQQPYFIIDRSFRVLGLSSALLFVNNYNYKWGPSLEIVYDESADASVRRELNPADGFYYNRIDMGRMDKRFSVGLSLKGEMSFRQMAFFGQLGYDLLHGHKYDLRLYQIAGIKVYVNENIFATFGIRTTHFSRAKFLYWSIGYTIKGREQKPRQTHLAAGG
jgi:hypothetical protein